MFPQAALPLQVFEERYKTMIKTCLDTDSQFGVALIKSGEEVGGSAVPYSVGTVAHIMQSKRVDGGRMLLTVVGLGQFRIREITQHHPYMMAAAELLTVEKESPVTEVELGPIREAVTEYVRLTLGLRGGWTRQTRLPDSPNALSYFIAGILQIELSEKQTLLEEMSTRKRLESELNILERESDALKERVAEELGSRRFSKH